MRHSLPLRRVLPIFSLALLVLSGAARAQNTCDFAPGVTVEATRAAVGVPVTVQVVASDPNGDAIASLTADTSGLPPGNNAVFAPNASNTAGILTWTPQAGQAGSFNVTYVASNALSGSATGLISVTDTGGAPFVQCPATLSAFSFEPIAFDVFAADPDGEGIASLTASGLPLGATFTVNSANTMGTFNWTPGPADGGSYEISFTATNSLSGTSTTVISILQSDRAPLVFAPATATGTEGNLLTICVRAFDPDGAPLASLTASTGPVFIPYSFYVSPSNEVGTFQWTPAIGQAGTYLVTFTASDGVLTASANTAITIVPSSGDHSPVVGAPSSVAGEEGSLLTVNVTASDPDGDAIGSLTASPLPPGAMFAAGAANTTGTLSWTPASGQTGTYFVTFDAANALSGAATTTINVTAVWTTNVFTVGADRTIRLGSNRPYWCANIEPVASAFSLTDVIPSSIVLVSPGTGSLSQISAVSDKTMVLGDRNANDVPDLRVCFLKGDLRALFSNVIGRQTLTLRIEGSLITGGKFHGDFAIDVVADGGQLAAAVSPNPLNPEATLSFGTSKGGPVRVAVYDVSGRLVRTLLDEPFLAAGFHNVRVSAWDGHGRQLPSGAYFFRIESAGEVTAGSFRILK